MEKKTPVKVFKVRMYCDRCKQGEMVPTGMVYTSLPGQYEHICNCCGYRTTYNIAYPTVAYEEIVKREKNNDGKK